MMGFPIHIVQVDNGHEFVNDNDKTSKESAFEKAAYNLGITIKRTRPYSPWQNGKVERSHREDGKVLYNRKVFTSEKDLINQVAKHERRYNSTAKTSLKFKKSRWSCRRVFQKYILLLWKLKWTKSRFAKLYSLTYPFIIFDKIAGILKNSLVSVTYVLTTKTEPMLMHGLLFVKFPIIWYNKI